MPSDTSLQQALAAVAPQRDAFRSAVTAASAQIGVRIRASRGAGDGRGERAAHELGAFARGRIDVARFTAVFEAGEALDPGGLARLERAHQVMTSLAVAGDDLLVLGAADAAGLSAAVGRALAGAGRAFAAARAAEQVRLGQHPPDEAELLERGLPFARWNRAERQIAPPVVVVLDGGQLQAGGLAEYLDGGVKIVLIVRGAAPAAPLVRLITPGVFVLQTADAAELAQIAAIDGPAVAALLPEGSARFVHRPGGERIWDRLEVQALPERPRASIGTVSLFQQVEELEQLRLLGVSRPPPVVHSGNGGSAAGAASAPAADPAERLAAWLLDQSGVRPLPEQGG